MTRLLAPADPVGGLPYIEGASGAQYSQQAGVVLVDAAEPGPWPTATFWRTLIVAGDLAGLEAAGWLILTAAGAPSGATSARPKMQRYVTGCYQDTTLSLLVGWDGWTWRSSVTGLPV